MADNENNTYLITGAGAGIGLAIARQFHETGANVVLFDKNEESVAALAATLGDRAVACSGDVRDAADNRKAVALALDTFSSLDGLVLNAGVFDGFLPLEATEEDLFDDVLSVNVKGYYQGDPLKAMRSGVTSWLTTTRPGECRRCS